VLYEEYVLRGGVIVLIPSPPAVRSMMKYEDDVNPETSTYPRCAEDILRGIQGSRYLNREAKE
ncbi:MAG: hypothetical protein WC372_08780, partial [Candidatus Neomarinimicrobiota bacterium]|jgi:hypothetical protein